LIDDYFIVVLIFMCSKYNVVINLFVDLIV